MCCFPLFFDHHSDLLKLAVVHSELWRAPPHSGPLLTASSEHNGAQHNGAPDHAPPPPSKAVCYAGKINKNHGVISK